MVPPLREFHGVKILTRNSVERSAVSGQRSAKETKLKIQAPILQHKQGDCKQENEPISQCRRETQRVSFDRIYRIRVTITFSKTKKKRAGTRPARIISYKRQQDVLKVS
jgi:hypothetical protein